MYGHINVILKSFIQTRFGEDSWKQVVSKSKCAAEYNAHAVYDDATSKKIIDAAVAVLGFKRDALLTMMGEYYLDYVRKIGHDELLRNLGENMLDFLENLDYVHTYMMSEYPDVNMPSFRVEPDSMKDKMVVHYYSFREGYHPLIIGILKAAGKIYYKSDIEIEVLSKTMEDVAKQKGKREHVVFSISVAKIKQDTGNMPPPTFVAQTRKHAENQIGKGDIDHVLDRLDQIRREQGEEGLPLNKGKVLQSKWKSVAKMSVLYGGFVPNYPSRLSIDSHTFCNAFPYHLVFNKTMNVVHAGVKVQQLLPAIRSGSARIDVFFEMLHPHSVDFNFENVKKFINTPFVLKTKSTKMVNTWGQRPMVIFRGQMLFLEEQNEVIYLCSPYVRCLKDLEDRKMFLADIPIHDVTRDLLWMELMNRYRKGGNNGTCGGKYGGRQGGDGKNMKGGVGAVVMSSGPRGGGYSGGGGGGGDNDDLRRQLQETQAALEEERQKNEWLYQAFLPPTTATQILNGQQPEAGSYHNVTVLFSDVVAFSHIIKRCKPNDVVNLLTQLHQKYNRLTKIHETYRVELIGDAYMVVSGVPDAVPTHAERIANTALGMLIAANEVLSPYDYGDKSKTVKIRIGLHTGTVICGVIGDKLPRFAVLGDTVNLASRMESHGIPGKIHLSGKTNDFLKGKGFKIEKRGKIEVRGQGNMVTFFLEENTNVEEDELMGRVSRARQDDAVEVTFINDGRQEEPPNTSGSRSPLISRNRIHPRSSGENTPSSRPETGDDEFVPMFYNDSGRGRRK